MTHTQAKIRELVCERIAACYREILWGEFNPDL